MKDLEEKCLRFVLKHYRVNKLDTQKALQTFRPNMLYPKASQVLARMWWLLRG